MSPKQHRPSAERSDVRVGTRWRNHVSGRIFLVTKVGVFQHRPTERVAVSLSRLAPDGVNIRASAGRMHVDYLLTHYAPADD